MGPGHLEMLVKVLGRYAPVTAAAVLTLNTIDIHTDHAIKFRSRICIIKNIGPPSHEMVESFSMPVLIFRLK